MLITLSMEPVALALYVLTDKEPRPGTHEEFIKPLWKQGVGSTVQALFMKNMLGGSYPKALRRSFVPEWRR